MKTNKTKFRIKKWKRRDIILLLERLELYISSGVSIDKALQISREGIPKRQKACIGIVIDAVESGATLSAGLSRSINVPQTITGLIENGESSGNLARTLLAARSLLEREDELLKKCISAMTYPVIIGIFSIILTLALVRGIMPQIIPMLKSLHVQLPLLTRITIGFSDSLTAYGIYFLIAIIVSSISFSFVYKKVYFIRRITHIFLTRIPIVGNLLRNYSTSVFLRSCGSLIESGLTVASAYKKTVSTISLLSLKEKFLSNENNISKGISIGNVISNNKMPAYIAPLLHAGEASGNLGASLLRAASILDRDIEHALQRMTSLIEPLMMAGMGLVVGAIALSIMMPIYDISKVLQK